MSQHPDDERNNQRNSPPPRRDNAGLPGFGPDLSVPSLIFDEYGEVKANVPGRSGAQTPNRQPKDETPLVPSLIFDEYGELKSSALQAFKPAPTPAPPPPANRAQAPARFNQPNPGAFQPQAYRSPLERPAYVSPAQTLYTAPVKAPPPQAAPVIHAQPGQPEKVAKVKKSGFRPGLALWIALGFILVALGVGVVLFLVLNKPAATPASTTPVSTGNLFPFRVLTPVATASGAGTPVATGPADGNDLDKLYNQAKAQLNNNQFKEAAATLEQLRDEQNRSGNIKHPDVPALLLKAYVSLGDKLNRSAQLADFKQSLESYQKALDTAKTLDAKDRNQQEESALQTRLDNGNLYVKAVTAYNEKELEAAVPLFSQLYAKDQNFRDAPSLYYDSLVRIGDGQFAENLLSDAYKSYARAVQIKNVADTRYAQARASSIENQLRQAGKPVPTAPKP